MTEFTLEKLKELLGNIYSKSNPELAENIIVTYDEELLDVIFDIVEVHGSIGPHTALPNATAKPMIEQVLRVKHSFFGDEVDTDLHDEDPIPEKPDSGTKWGMILFGDSEVELAGCVVFKGAYHVIQAGSYDEEDGRNAIGFLSSVQYAVNQIESISTEGTGSMVDAIKDVIMGIMGDSDIDLKALGFEGGDTEEPEEPEDDPQEETPPQISDIGKALDDLFTDSKDKPK